MKAQLTLHPDYGFLEKWIKSLPQTYNTQGHVIIDGRNRVSDVEVDGRRYVIKYFNRITVFNRYIYRFLRASKGQRAYDNALVLLSNGISTPFPVANLDVYEHGKLTHNFFVSRHVDYPSAYDLMSRPFQEIETELKALAAFLYRLHRLGIFHADLNLTNVMYCNTAQGIEFCLIDNNRIRFRPYTRRRALRNLRRLQMPLVNYAAFVDEYAHQSNQDVFKTFGMTMFYREANREFRKMRQSLKRWFLGKIKIQKVKTF